MGSFLSDLFILSSSTLISISQIPFSSIELGSAFFVMTPFRYNVFVGVFYAMAIGGGGGGGQLGMAHRSDGPASSLRMFGHVHRAMCGGGCQFEVLEEPACA